MNNNIFYKYQGAGNDFLIGDNRDGRYNDLDKDGIIRLCDRRYGFGADGLMLLEKSGNYDFRMVFFNPDGSGGMMCGNGGRCIAAFASEVLGGNTFVFEAADGIHKAEILSKSGRTAEVRLQMIDVKEIRDCGNRSYFLNTGTRHYVRFVDGGLSDMDITEPGKAIRYSAEFAPEGTNVNFVEAHASEGYLAVRTYEKGVEDETFACGTGIVASSVAAWYAGIIAGKDRISIDIRAKMDRLSVDFLPGTGDIACDVWLTGPAVLTGCVRELDSVSVKEY